MAAPGLPAPRAAAPAVRPGGAAGLLFGQALNPNRAAAAALEALPAIGPTRAAAIVAARAREPFCRVEDLRRVHGIGPHTLASAAFGLAVEPTPPGCPEGDVGRRAGEGYRPGDDPRGAEAVAPPAGGRDVRRAPDAGAEGAPGASPRR